MLSITGNSPNALQGRFITERNRFIGKCIDKYTSRLTRENFTVQLGTDGKVYRVLQEALQNHKLQSGTPVSTTCHTIKPQELEPLRLAYEEAKKEFDALLESYPEYITLDSLYKRAITTEQKKDRKVALDGFYQRIYKEDKAYRPLLEKRRKAIKEHYIACAYYLLNECKKNREIVPEIYNYKTERILKETNPDLQQLSIEISTLSGLQRETTRKYQRLKYNLKED